MRKLFVALLLVLGAAFLVMPAFAQDETNVKLMNAKMAQEIKSRAARLGGSAVDPGLNDTTYVGYNPAYAGSNYWSIGVGSRNPPGTHGFAKSDIPAIPASRTGYWDWDHPVHGDSLQGWWPVRDYYTAFLANQSDVIRPWTAADFGNQVNYVINQGAGYRRTFGVVGVWHQDIGNNGGSMTLDPSPRASDVNPKAPNWTPINGAGSAWCGLRTHGDVTRMDAVTGNPFNEDALGNELVPGTPAVATGPGWTYYKFPGYGDGWDQMLYRDIDITNATGASNVSVTFSYRTRMSTLKTTQGTRATGWFDKDPLSVAAGNLISGSAGASATPGCPIDSFMVYVGAPVVDTVGAAWTASDGSSRKVFDVQRRWFGELVQAAPPAAPPNLYELFTTYGNDPPLTSGNNASNTVTVSRPVTYQTLRNTIGNKVRLVFRIKTNRGRGTNANEVPSSDMSGSLPSSYSSGGLGAAELDDVNVNLGAGNVLIGDFNSPTAVDNSPKTSALDAWKSTGKPPGIYHHVDELTNLAWADLCGPPGSIYRICDVAGNVISAGDHDLGESFNGPPNTSEAEMYQGITSPTINLCYSHLGKNALGCVGGKNEVGLDCDTAVPTAEYAMLFNEYLGGLNLNLTGAIFQAYAISYPAQQNDGGLNGLTGPTEGVRCWGAFRFPNFAEFNPDPQCFDEIYHFSQNDMVKTTNGNGVPDSVRIGLRKISQCFAFPTATCGSTLGLYWDNVSFAILDGTPLPMSVDIWQWFQDTFPANENPALPGTANFDTCAALVQGALNGAPVTADANRYDSPQDTIFAIAGGDSVEVQLKFRIWPGCGNYKVVGDQCSGLRRVPTDTTRIQSTDMALTDPQKKFWTAYIIDPGKQKTGFPTTGPCKNGGPLRFDQRWNELVWCNARCDTAETNLFPVAQRGIGIPQAVGQWSATYHESDPKFNSLGIPRNKCFLVDTAAAANYTNITCSSVPVWVTTKPGTGYNGSATTVEGTKILPDGIFTAGTHVEYFFFKKDLNTGATAMVPDTNMVFPQNGEGPSFDGHRWQEWSVLPDCWKAVANCGIGRAAMLYVDWNDRRGDELAWTAVADSIGASAGTRLGANNGYVGKSKNDINDPATFVNRNCQAGTTWDMYGVKAAESLNNDCGSIGARKAYRVGGTLLTDKPARNAPTPEMLAAYYRIMLLMSGDLNTSVLGPFDDRSQDDSEVINQFVLAGNAGAHRGLYCSGSGFVEDLDATGNVLIEGILGVSLRDASYLRFSTNSRACIDLIPTSIVTSRGDIYGIRNVCTETQDVLNKEGDAVVASYYDPVGANPILAPYVASVFMPAEPAGNPNNHWQALIDGWNTNLNRSRGCDKTIGRMVYYINVFTNVFGKICAVQGAPGITTEVPNNNDGSVFVDFAGVGNNPLRQGSAVINLTLAKADRVTVKIFDVSGRLVRTLSDGQMFKAGKVDPALTWDGLDNNGRQVARGAYFVSVRFQNSKFDASRKMIVLK